MKKLIIIILLVLPLFGICQPLQSTQIVKIKALTYINGKLSNPKSYASIQWSKLGVEITRYDNSKNVKDLLLEIKRLSSLQAASKLDSIIIKKQLDTLISLDNRLKSRFIPVTNYIIMHAFTAKSVNGKTDTLVYTFRFDENLKLLDVDTDPPALQIEKNKKEIEEDEEYKRELSSN